MPSHIDLFPTLRQDWAQRATSGPPTGSATTSLLSTQSSKGWHDRDPDLRIGTQALLKEEEDNDTGQGDTMVLWNPLIEKRLLGQRWSENQRVF